MARVLTDGAELGTTIRIIASSGTGTGVATAQKRTGTYSYTTGNNGGQNGYNEHALPAAVTEYYIRFAFRINTNTGVGLDSNGIILSMMNGGSTAARIRIQNLGIAASFLYDDGTTNRGTSSTFVLNTNEWHVIEAHFKHAASPTGQIDIKYDGRSVATFAGAVNSQSQATRFRIHGKDAGSNDIGVYYDDLAVNDTAGGVDDSWCGDGGVLAALVPNGAGNYTDLIADSGTPYQRVDEVVANGDTDYVYESTIDKKSTYTLTNTSGIPTGGSIARLWIETNAKETAAAGDKIATLLRSNTTDDQGTDQSLTLAYTRYASAEYLVDPADSNPWDTTKVDALEAGAVVR